MRGRRAARCRRAGRRRPRAGRPGAPGATTPSSPSRREQLRVHERRRAQDLGGGSTRARIANSRFCSLWVSPRRSVPKPIATPGARAISREARPASSTSFTLALADRRETERSAELVDLEVGDERRARGRRLASRIRVAVGASIRLPCSMLRTPASTARADRLGRVRVRHGVGPPTSRLLDDRAHLLGRVLEVPDRIRGRRHTARRHDLQLERAAPKLLARRLAARRRPRPPRGRSPSCGCGKRRPALARRAIESPRGRRSGSVRAPRRKSADRRPGPARPPGRARSPRRRRRARS